MVWMSRLIVALASAGLFTAPLCADVLPTRRIDETSGSAARVEARMVELGVSADAARAQAGQLTGSEAAYFARSPERIQLVGQNAAAGVYGGTADNLWWEWVGGALAFTGTIVLFSVFVFD